MQTIAAFLAGLAASAAIDFTARDVFARFTGAVATDTAFNTRRTAIIAFTTYGAVRAVKLLPDARRGADLSLGTIASLATGFARGATVDGAGRVALTGFTGAIATCCRWTVFGAEYALTGDAVDTTLARSLEATDDATLAGTCAARGDRA